ncbi:MAG: IS66 family insertion sequence element accessory protein TnpB [Candidatus Melainabacteria bacterium]|nr:IS66 family insertion sequence element accessory protein TnpB [Candidatus Melainabacteria bacterium]MBK9142759.1 IS66 family insertion sequence element accessory protein TnpB [Candidatus Melainabacteria bacterium]
MIAPNNVRVFLCTEDTDMRKSFSALCGLVRRSMNLDPLSGSLFVFRNKRADKIKLLYFDRDGLAIWYKALQKGSFRFPDLSNISSAGVEIDASTLRLILDGIDLRSIQRQQRYRISQDGQVEHLLLREAELGSEADRPL